MREKDQALLERVKQLLEAGSLDQIPDLVRSIHPADVVDILENLRDEEQQAFFHAIPSDTAADIIQELDPVDQARIIKVMDNVRSSQILKEMDSDDAADLLADLPEAKAEKLLGLMNAEGEDVRELLQYDEDSSGGIMATEYVSVRADWTVEQTLAELRRLAPEAETVYYVYVLDEQEHLVGVLSLRDLVISDLRARIGTIMNPKVVSVSTDVDQEEAAQLFKKYGFLTLPVVDEENKLTGIITADDILDVVEEEATEDIQKMAATLPLTEPYLDTGLGTHWTKRVSWLLVLFLAESITGGILQKFSAAMEAFIALTFFIPLLIDSGGNAGSQAAAIIIRGLAVRDIRVRDFFRVIWREAWVGLLLGLAMAVVAFFRAWFVGGTPLLGFTVCLAVCAIVAFGTLVGAALPIIATKIGFDPAVVAGPLITTIVDALGLMIYFTIAKAVLGI
ncbi:MAG: magnesium transporter [Firmicutes bacterium]|jgi:magnesium transporter|nr:magnesium transporter [Bacillota bacterium]